MTGLKIRAHRRLTWQFWALVVSAVLFLAAAGIGAWYGWALQPKSGDAHAQRQRIIIEKGDGVSRVADKLKQAGIIRSALALRIYTETTGARAKIQTGGYMISSSESVPNIVDHLVSGRTDEFNLTILAGLTLKELGDRLEADGYTRAEINQALNDNYTHPLLESRPAGADLEGYIFPETYRVSAREPLRDVFMRSFDEFYGRLRDEGLLKGFARQGLTVHEALTLGSIVQEEVSDPAEQRQVAQVFHKRLNEKLPLGSDPTFKYAAMKMGVRPSINLDSPYNTRVNAGLPPGPIATMELSAIRAVASPAPGDYSYFVSGDDGVTHFSRTLEEHEEKTRLYCTTLCQ